MELTKSDKGKVWICLLVIFTFGALTVNAIWVYYYNKIDLRHVKQIDELTAAYESRFQSQERSYKYQLGEMRNRVEKKLDVVLQKLEKAPQVPVVIDARREIERVKND